MNSRDKGKRGEREWAKVLQGLGLEAKRGVQFQGGPESPDVVGGFPGTHCEVKRVEDLDVHKAIEQAVRDAAGKSVPYVAHRKNGKPWLVTFLADQLFEALNLIKRKPNEELEDT